MKIISWIKALCTIIILLITGDSIFSQVIVERSKDKVTISGTAYYIHQVRKGETSYSISRAYNITVEELNKENPPAVYGIKEGQSLRIPVKEVASAKICRIHLPLLNSVMNQNLFIIILSRVRQFIIFQNLMGFLKMKLFRAIRGLKSTSYLLDLK